MSSRRLRCRLRKRALTAPARLSSSRTATPCPNLFARLSHEGVKRLYEQASRRADDDTDGISETDEATTTKNCWNLSTSTSLDFLPLCVTFPGEDESEEEEVIYVSYNGGEISLLSEHDSCAIELPECLLPSSQSNSCQEVLVEALTHVENAASVHLEPLTVRDWELLQQHAEQLEGGDLLQQISVVYPHQIVPLQVGGGNDMARVRVLDSNFDPPPDESIWPSATPPRRRCCLRLVADTEVIVSPLASASPKTANNTPILRLLPCWEDYSNAMQEFAKACQVPQRPLSLCPFTVAIHPNVLSSSSCEMFGSSVRAAGPGLVSLQLSSSSSSEDQQSTTVAIAKMVLCEDISEDCAVLHPLIRLQLGGRLFLDQISLRILNHVEVDRMTKRFCDYALQYEDGLGDGSASLSLVPVTLVTPKKSVWRVPTTVGGGRRRQTSTTAVSSAPPLSIQLPDEMEDLPVQIGGLLRLPLHGDDSEKQLFRVELAGEADKERQEDDGPQILFSRDLIKYFGGNPWGGVGPHWAGRDSVSLPHEIHVKDYLPNVSILRGEVLQFAKRAVESSGALICGPRGSGRSHLALVFAAYAEFARGDGTVYMDCKKLRDSRRVGMKDILLELTRLLQDAVRCSSCCVVLDNLDEIIPANDSGGPMDESSKSVQINPAAVEQSKLIGDALCSLLDVARSKSRLLVIATCETTESISEVVISSAMLGSPIMVPPLSSRRREDLFLQLVRQDGPEDVRCGGCDVGRLTEGYRPQDLVQVALRICERLRRTENSGQSFDTIVAEELSTFVPLGRASASVERSDAGLSWSQVGGMYRAKEHLTSTIIKPSIYRRIYESSQVRLPRGILLFGPSGCGKSCVVPALAKECGFRLITCRGAELLDKYIGASEANVRELFARATAVAPSILFLDELDALAPVRGSDHTGVTDRIVNQLLTFLDGVEDVSGREKVYIVAASSRPDKIDPALLRPGRLEKHVYVGFPENEDEVSNVLCKLATHYNISEEAVDQIHSGEFVRRLVQEKGRLNPRMSPADIKGAFNSAQVLAVHEALNEGRTENVVIGVHHLQEALGSSRPSLSSDEYSRLQLVYAPYRGDDEFARSNAADPADAASGNRLAASKLDREPLRTALR